MGAFARDQRGAIAILAAVLLPVTLGAVALAAEYGNGLVVKAENQRIADLASYAGAMAYVENDNSEAAMQTAAIRVAALNGVAADDVAATLTSSPRDASKPAVHVIISTPSSLLLAPILGAGDLINVASQAYTAIEASAAPTPGCVIALDAAQTGIQLSGGTGITATGCTVASNASVNIANCGITINSPQLTWDTVAPTGCTGGITGTILKATATDPYVDYDGKVTAVNRLTTVGALTAPAAPAGPTFSTTPTGGVSITFAYEMSTTKNKAPLKEAPAIGCSASLSGSMWTLSCPKGSNKIYNFATISIGGGRNLTIAATGTGTATFNFSAAMSVNSGQTFNMQGGAGTTYNFGSTFTSGGTTTADAGATYNFIGTFTQSNGTTTLNSGTYKFGGDVKSQNSGALTLTPVSGSTIQIGGEIYVTGSAVATFGAANYDVVKGIRVEGGTSPSFGAGTFNLGQSTTSCNWDAGTVSICNKSTHLSFAGPSTFNLTAGIYVNGGSKLTMGNGSTANSYTIGHSSLGHSLMTGGGSLVKFNDTAGGTFVMTGNLNSPSGGGSCLRLPVAANHDIKGYFNVAGGVWMGPTVYTISGYMHLGASGGGAVNCSSIDLGTVSVDATGVTIVLGGAGVPTSGSAANLSYYAAAGYNNIKISAPTTGTTAGLAIIGPTSTTNTTGAKLDGGASGGLYSGAFYFPNGPITVTGGASATGGAGCLELIGSRITLSGGATVGTKCATTGGASGGETLLALVQ